MPLIDSKSDQAFRANVAEMRKSGRPIDQALAAAYRIKRGHADGGPAGYARGGLIRSAVPGRSDKIAMRVGDGSYIVPADVPSAIGQGNSSAGGEILSRMFKIGAYGSGATGQVRAPRRYADGGAARDAVPIIAAGGEMVLPPHVVREVGHGDLKAGHRVLDAFVLRTRREHIQRLKKLRPPKR